LGGTKLRAALINPRGQIKNAVTGNVNQRAGLPGLLELFKELEQQLPKVKYKVVSVASAGPLHPAKGVLLNPTNFFTTQKTWGVVPIVAQLKKIFKKPVLLENDAAAAVLGEMWKGGHGKKNKNIVAMTLGTGVGVGVIADGALVRAGRGLHPEGGHIPINAEDHDYPCGCGAYGCIEAYLAGTHFAKRMSARVGRSLTGKEAVELAQEGDLQIQASFKEYGRHLAQAIRSLCVLFAPEVVVLSGGFSHASHLFLPETKKVLPSLLERYREGIDLLPEVKVSNLQNDAGILGAAYIAIQK
jgi:glucokinase